MVADGHRVTTEAPRNVAQLQAQPASRWIELDLTTDELTLTPPDGADVLVHLGTRASTAQGAADPHRDAEMTVTVTDRLLDGKATIKLVAGPAETLDWMSPADTVGRWRRGAPT